MSTPPALKLIISQVTSWPAHVMTITAFASYIVALTLINLIAGDNEIHLVTRREYKAHLVDLIYLLPVAICPKHSETTPRIPDSRDSRHHRG